MQEEVSGRLDVAKSKEEDGESDILVLRFETAEEVLTPKRREILSTLKNNEIGSVTELSELVDRDLGRVSKDLKKLYEADVIEFSKDGGSKIPEIKHDTIDFEPIILQKQ